MAKQSPLEPGHLLLREMTSAELAQAYVTDFFDGLLDGHDFLVDQLDGAAAHSYSCSGFESHLSSVPEPLAAHLQLDLQAHPEQAAISTSLAFSISPQPERQFRLDFLCLEPADRPGILLAFEDPFTRVTRANEELDLFLGNALLSQTLRAIVPNTRSVVPDEKIARAIFELSPTAWHAAEVRRDELYLLATTHETLDDSTRSVNVQLVQSHASGKDLLLQATAEERLAQASCGIGATQSVLLDAGRRVTINHLDLIEGRRVEVKRPRYSHAKALREAVELLLDESWGIASVRPWLARPLNQEEK